MQKVCTSRCHQPTSQTEVWSRSQSTSKHHVACLFGFPGGLETSEVLRGLREPPPNSVLASFLFGVRKFKQENVHRLNLPTFLPLGAACTTLRVDAAPLASWGQAIEQQTTFGCCFGLLGKPSSWNPSTGPVLNVMNAAVRAGACFAWFAWAWRPKQAASHREGTSDAALETDMSQRLNCWFGMYS